MGWRIVPLGWLVETVTTPTTLNTWAWREMALTEAKTLMHPESDYGRMWGSCIGIWNGKSMATLSMTSISLAPQSALFFAGKRLYNPRLCPPGCMHRPDSHDPGQV